jgi:predicted HicB family RNase H-like nuclease
MKQKLTLYVSEELVTKAKLRAVLQKTSLSQIVEKLLADHLAKLEGAKRKSKSK